MKQKTIVIIGGTSGIGRAAVRYFLNTEYKLIVLYRSEYKLNETLKDFNQSVIKIPCDLCSFESMQKACLAIRNHTDCVDVLINNAGLWEFGLRKETENGIEKTFQVNVLAPAFFQYNLQDLLLQSKEPRVITTASLLHFGNINFSDIEYKQRFSGYQAYRQSKLAVILLNRFWAKQNPKINYYCFHPGVVKTELGRSAGWWGKTFFNWFGISPEKGAQTMIFLTESPVNTLESGAYYAKCKLTKTVSKTSYDMTVAEKLWQVVEGYIEKTTVEMSVKI